MKVESGGSGKEVQKPGIEVMARIGVDVPVGEETGELDTMLERAAAHQERELDAVLQAVVGLLGPLMILLMGGLVLLIVLAMLLPIFELNQLVQ